MLEFGQFISEKVTLEYHKRLNPRLFKGRELKKDIREKLLRAGEAFREFNKIIKKEDVIDIWFTGGNANYNYTSQSDLDVHLVVDKNKLGVSLFVEDYLKDKKKLFSLSHHILINGYTVEGYVQDISEVPHIGQGVYSLNKDTWILEPTFNSEVGSSFHDKHLKKKVEQYENLIDDLVEKKLDQGHIEIIKSKLKALRGDSIAKFGEFAFGNLIFKSLRNTGHLDKLNDYESELENQNNYGI